MTLSLILITLAIIVLYFGAEAFVKGSSSLALSMGIPPVIVGLTFVAYGTSIPELMTSVSAAFLNEGDIVAGNIIGANTFNNLFILGIAALIAPMRISMQLLRIDAPIMLAVTAVFVIVLFNNSMSRLEGLVFLAGAAAYTMLNIKLALKKPDEEVEKEFDEGIPRGPKQIAWDIVYMILGFGLVYYGAEVMVGNAVKIAREFNISEAVIGITIMGIGTSLPEAAITIIAAARKEADLALGNIIGSVTFRTLGILGACAVIQPFQAPDISLIDLGLMLLSSLILLPFFFHRFTLDRWEGVILLGLYGAYMYHLWPK